LQTLNSYPIVVVVLAVLQFQEITSSRGGSTELNMVTQDPGCYINLYVELWRGNSPVIGCPENTDALVTSQCSPTTYLIDSLNVELTPETYNCTRAGDQVTCTGDHLMVVRERNNDCDSSSELCSAPADSVLTGECGLSPACSVGVVLSSAPTEPMPEPSAAPATTAPVELPEASCLYEDCVIDNDCCAAAPICRNRSFAGGVKRVCSARPRVPKTKLCGNCGGAGARLPKKGP
jgi:hypothetical protein